jgi:hypothetical protein
MSRRVRPILAVLLVGATAACGVPTGEAPTEIAAADVPYGLAAPTSSAAPADAAEARQNATTVYLVADDQRLVPRGREVAGSGRREQLDDLLGQLADGPTAEERKEQLSTLLPPDAELSVVRVVGETATIDLADPGELPSGTEGGRAVGQIVLTATSLPGVRAVLLSVGGSPVDAPLPSGELTPRPVTAVDYDPFLAPQPDDEPGAPPFLANAEADRADPSADARLTVSDIRIGSHDRFDRVVFEVAGRGSPGWDVRYVAAADVPSNGGPVEVSGRAVLQVTVTGTADPVAPGAERYAGPDPLAVAGTEVVTEVDLYASSEGRTVSFVGTTERRPFRVYLMENPTRVVLEVAGRR